MGASKDMLDMIGLLGGGLLGGITAPQGQKLQSFSGTGGTDPVRMGHDVEGLLSDFLTSTMDRAAEPVTMKTTVNPLPNFTGGGLPFTIAAPGQDANRLNPALRTTPGVTIPRRALSGGPGVPPPGAVPGAPDWPYQPPGTTDPNAPPVETTHPGEQSLAMHKDGDQAAAAIELLKHAGLQF